MKRTLLVASAVALAVAASAFAQPGPGGYGPGYGMGPGMMGGYGGGYGMGPGMMGGYGMGPGMMGGYGGGYGMGPGMMGGYGMGPGMMGGVGGLYGLDLSDEQRTKISEIQRELFGKHWALMGTMHQQGGPLEEAFASGKFDEKAARKAFDTMSEARKQMFEASLQAYKRIDALLTPEQRKQLQSGWRGNAPGPRK